MQFLRRAPPVISGGVNGFFSFRTLVQTVLTWQRRLSCRLCSFSGRCRSPSTTELKKRQEPFDPPSDKSKMAEALNASPLTADINGDPTPRDTQAASDVSLARNDSAQDVDAAPDGSYEDDESSDDDYRECEISFKEVTDLIGTACQNSAALQPPLDCDRKTWDDYWRAVLSSLGSTVASDARMPDFITSPPLKYLNIEIMSEEPPGGCPCCAPDGLPSFLVEAAGGIRKTELVKQISAALYGEGRSVGRKEDRPVVRKFDYMMEGDGRNLIYSGRSPRQIWMYCDGMGKLGNE